MATFVNGTQFYVESCCSCGIQFAMEQSFVDRRRSDHKDFYCPNGHTLVYRGESKADKLQRELEQVRGQVGLLQNTATRMQRERDAIAKSHKKMRTRIMNGVCPCCNRSFENLRNHMASQHPDFGADRTMKALREAFGMTQQDVAREAGVVAAYVSLYERGKPLPVEARESLDWWAERQATA